MFIVYSFSKAQDMFPNRPKHSKSVICISEVIHILLNFTMKVFDVERIWYAGFFLKGYKNKGFFSSFILAKGRDFYEQLWKAVKSLRILSPLLEDWSEIFFSFSNVFLNSQITDFFPLLFPSSVLMPQTLGFGLC